MTGREVPLALPEPTLMNGLDATRQIKRARPQTEVAILSAVDTEEVIHEVLQAGARAYLFKSEAGAQLVAALQALARHQPYFSSRVSETIFARYLAAGPAASAATPERLTAREREIVQLLAEGKRSKEAAAVLGISVRTVETHRATIMRKLGLASPGELVRYAIRNRIIEA